jgi:hypothetical protein
VCPDAKALQAEAAEVTGVGVMSAVVAAVPVGDVAAGDVATAAGDALTVAAELTLAAAADALAGGLADDGGAAGSVLVEVAAHPALASANAVTKTAAPHTLIIRVPVIAAPCNRDERYARS